ncbi:MAG: thermonuclease family protein [Spirochaetaceae bacterium]|nr:thermonuclease family protein [Spirochaetaceae bacterium]
MSAIAKRLACLAFLLLSFAALATADTEPYRVTSLLVPLTRYADRARMTAALVVQVVDGDTVKVEIDEPPRGLGRRETVRLIGVDTPESVDRRKEVERFAREASGLTKDRLLGARVRLAFDRELRDRYGRLLAYVFLEDGSCFDLELIAGGYGYAYVKYPFFFIDEFRNAELAARYGKKGLWGW